MSVLILVILVHQGQLNENTFALATIWNKISLGF